MPAILKVLEGEPKVMLHCAACSQELAKGMWRPPQRAISQWISSEMTIIPREWQKRARRASVSLSQSIPAGLCGLERISIRHLSSQTCSRFSKSIE